MAIVPHGLVSSGGGTAIEHEDHVSSGEEVQSYEEAERQGPSEAWLFWSEEIQASLNAERRFREEGREAERAYFGDDTKAYTTDDWRADEHKTNIIHANIEVLKPLLFSDIPEPMVRRRFGGDGANADPTDRVSAIVAQRLAQYLVETTTYAQAMEACRDDWLIPGRATARVMYSANFEQQASVDPITGQSVMQDVKVSERLKVRHWQWSRALFSAVNTWDDNRWCGWETPLTKKQVEKRFGQDIASRMSYPINSMKGDSRTTTTDDMAGFEPDKNNETTNTPSVSAFNQCIAYEIWDKESRKVIWWSPHYREDILDSMDDPLGLEDFFDCPRPLLAVTKNGMLTPRPDTAFYRARADEIDMATRKLASILKTLSVSGLYPGKMVEEIKHLLDGKNKMIPVAEWVSFLEKGGTSGVVQWLPVEQFIKVAQALVVMREQSKQELYEISGISDIVRGQSNPNETLGAQQMKGNYTNIRLRDKQSKMNAFARDTIRLMVEVAVEHFDTETITKIVNMDTVPSTEADLAAIKAQIEQMALEFQEQMQEYEQLAALAQEAGMEPPPPPQEPPEPPFFEDTSMERVHANLRDDMTRKFSLSIETDATVLQDQEEDKKARVEFLQAFTAMAETLFPLASSGVVDMKMVKELLLFAVRGFPKSRTLEGMLSALPDKMPDQGPPPEDPTITAAKIRAEVDKMMAEMDAQVTMSEGEANRKNKLQLAGAKIMADAAQAQHETDNAPPAQGI